MKVKTLNYDVRFKYPLNAAVFIDDNNQFTTDRDSQNRIPFGKVVKSPTNSRQQLEIRVNTDIFKIEIFSPQR